MSDLRNMSSPYQSWSMLFSTQKTQDCEEEKECLATFGAEIEGRASSDTIIKKNAAQKYHFRHFLILQFVLLLIYTFLSIMIVQVSKHQDIIPQRPYTLASEVSQTQEIKTLDFRVFSGTPFRGEPGPKVDSAWDNLFANAYIRLSPQELEKLGLKSVPLQDGSGDYLGALAVYHQLHCLHYLYQSNHPEYYTMNETNISVADHADHCIDMLRQIIMCRADTAIMTASWREGFPLAWPENNAVHECRSWDAVNAWAGEKGRVVDQSDSERFLRWISNPDYVRTHGYIDVDDVN